MVIFHGYVSLPEGEAFRSLFSGWWFFPTPLKNDGVKVSWDDDIPKIWEVIKAMFQTTKRYHRRKSNLAHISGVEKLTFYLHPAVTTDAFYISGHHNFPPPECTSTSAPQWLGLPENRACGAVEDDAHH